MKVVKCSGYMKENLIKRVYKALYEMVVTNSHHELTGFELSVFLIQWEIDKRQDFTKLKIHFGNHKKPESVSNLLYMYEDDESLENMK